MSGGDYFNIDVVASAFLAKLMPFSIGPLALRIGDSSLQQFYAIICLFKRMQYHDSSYLTEQNQEADN